MRNLNLVDVEQRSDVFVKNGGEKDLEMKRISCGITVLLAKSANWHKPMSRPRQSKVVPKQSK